MVRADNEGAFITKAWVLSVVIAALLAVNAFIANATVSNGRDISALQASAVGRDRELDELKSQLRDIRADIARQTEKLDRLLSRP